MARGHQAEICSSIGFFVGKRSCAHTLSVLDNAIAFIEEA
jgi:hypothetical protein